MNEQVEDYGPPRDVDSTVAIALLALGMTAGMLLLLVVFQLVPKHEDESTNEFDAVREFTEHYYVKDLEPEELTARALSGMLQSLDVHSSYFDRSQSEGHRRRVEGDFRGTGIVFRATSEEPRILFPVKGTPAWNAGVRVGDRILEIDGEAMTGLAANEVRERVAPQGRNVIQMRVEGLDGEIRELELEPQILVEPSVRHSHVVEGTSSIGYLALTSFTNNTPDEFDQAVTSLVEQGARALVIDLRFNLGGVLDAAVHVVGRFLDEGVVVSSEGRIHREVHRADRVEALFEGLRLIVLVNGNSASASEVVASALQDHRLAVVIGEPTYGKGLIQSTRSFPRFGSRAKVTSGYFYTPSGRNFDRTVDPDRDFGILPDFLVGVSRASALEIRSWIARFDPPVELLEQLEAWDAVADEDILPMAPSDAQLNAALALLAGEVPAPTKISTRHP